MKVLASFEPWIGVDLDGTLALKSDEFDGSIGAPIKPMLNLVRLLLSEGRQIKIFTARAADPSTIPDIQDWLEQECELPRLEVTNEKDPGMILLYDDKAVQVVPNKGILVG